MFLSSRGTPGFWFSMQVSIQCYRARIGCFNGGKTRCSNGKKSFFSRTFLHFLLCVFLNNAFFKMIASFFFSFTVSIFLFLCICLLVLTILITHVHDALCFLSSAGNLLVQKPTRAFTSKLFHFFELSLFTKVISSVIMLFTNFLWYGRKKSRSPHQ